MYMSLKKTVNVHSLNSIRDSVLLDTFRALALRSSSNSIVNIFFLNIFFRGFSKFYENRVLNEANF